MVDRRQGVRNACEIQERRSTESTRQRSLDAVNRRLLAELSAEPRLSMAALARKVGMSAPAVTERVQRLERDGIITGYRMIIDPAAIGLPVTSYVRIRPGSGAVAQAGRPGRGSAGGDRVLPDHR